MWQEAVKPKDGSEYPIFKVMLQRVDPHEKPSYWKGALPDTQSNDTQEFPLQYICEKCEQKSPMAFKDQSSTCLNRDCTDFFISKGTRLQRHKLEYRKEFLEWTRPFTGDQAKVPASVPSPPGKDAEGYGTELRCRTGMVCPRCHHCDSRVFFSYWKCGSCSHVHMAEPEPYPMAGIEKETREHTKRLLKSKNSELFKEDGTTIFMSSAPKTSILTRESTSKSITKDKARKSDVSEELAKDKKTDTKGFVTKFSTNDERSTRTIYMIFDADGNLIGSLVHERPSTALKESLCGANELWDKIQKPGVTKDFKRNAARCSGSKTFHSFKHHF